MPAPVSRTRVAPAFPAGPETSTSTRISPDLAEGEMAGMKLDRLAVDLLAVGAVEENLPRKEPLPLVRLGFVDQHPGGRGSGLDLFDGQDFSRRCLPNGRSSRAVVAS